ncbi:MAG: hypothetical protein IJ909_01125 [Fibrobacter sp.]|nr:hypothetical protein [Fibrobacter sp.]
MKLTVYIIQRMDDGKWQDMVQKEVRQGALEEMLKKAGNLLRAKYLQINRLRLVKANRWYGVSPLGWHLEKTEILNTISDYYKASEV